MKNGYKSFGANCRIVQDQRHCTGAFNTQILIPHTATMSFACDFGPQKRFPCGSALYGAVLPCKLVSKVHLEKVEHFVNIPKDNSPLIDCVHGIQAIFLPFDVKRSIKDFPPHSACHGTFTALYYCFTVCHFFLLLSTVSHYVCI